LGFQFLSVRSSPSLARIIPTNAFVSKLVKSTLVARVIMAGVRISVIINIGTAMIGAVTGAGGLGSPIVAGLVQDNIAYIIEAAVPAAILAVIADQLLAGIEELFA